MHAIPESFRGVFTTRCYTNPRLPYLYLTGKLDAKIYRTLTISHGNGTIEQLCVKWQNTVLSLLRHRNLASRKLSVSVEVQCSGHTASHRRTASDKPMLLTLLLPPSIRLRCTWHLSVCLSIC